MSPAAPPEFIPPHQDVELKKQLAWCLDEEIVISGISGRFPEADSVEELKQKLYDGIDLVTEDDRRWPAGIYGIPKRAGKLKDLSRFDASAFGINSKLADEMDPQMRLLLETTQEAIIDAGINPVTIRGSRTGVFVGNTCLESIKYWTDSEEMVHGYGMLGASLSMFANRISFTFDFKGPSFGLDNSCSSSFYALQQAIVAMNTGMCDSAIVAGTNLLLQPAKTLLFQKMNFISPDGISKPLDDNSGGFERSEAVVVYFLQKRKVSKRIYAELLSAVCTNDGNKEDGFLNLSHKIQVETIRQALAEGRVRPEDIGYVETHTMGTKLGDSIEVNALAEVLCPNREQPLLVGCVKSNMGHTEAASGMCSLTKVLLALETGVIAPNLHFEKPNRFIPALLNSQIKVVDKPTPLKENTVIAINNIGMAGTNSIILLRGNRKSKISTTNPDKFRLLCASGRSVSAVNATLDKAVLKKDDEEFLWLFNSVYSKDAPIYDYKGYAVVTDTVVKDVQQVTGGSDRPIWFVFSGMGSQWAGMARDLIKIPVCKKALDNVRNILAKEGYDLYEYLMSEDETTFDNILHALCAIASIQIALVDLLFSFGINPDGLIGHSAGELGCAYADGALTAEETILASYYRGRALLEADVPSGSMAAVGLTWEETKKRVPEGIYAACHNSADSVTVSGPPEAMKQFVADLKAEGVFAREVKSSGFGFHSKYILNAGPVYKAYLEKTIKSTKPRTKRWISTSVEETKWDIPEAKTAGPEYHVNNLLSPVLFEEGLKFVPENAILLEIAPHHLMQSVLKRALGSEVTVLGLLKRQHKNNLEFLLSNIGNFYIAGGHADMNALLDSSPTYPVSRGTPMLQSLVEWDHSAEWTIPDSSHLGIQKSGVVDVTIDLTSDEYNFISGHRVDGKIVFPGVGYTIAAWKVFAKLHGMHHEDFPVVFDDIQFLRATIIPENGSVTFTVSYLPTTRKMEISEGSAVLMKCFIRQAKSFDEERLQCFPTPSITRDETIILNLKSEIYKFFTMLGFTYTGPFLGIHDFDIAGIYSSLEFHDNYTTFLDTMIQFPFYDYGLKILHLPVQIKRLLIHPIAHRQMMETVPKSNGIPIFPATHSDHISASRAGGVEMRGVSFNVAAAKAHMQYPVLEKYEFVPYHPDDQVLLELNAERTVKLFTDIVIENNPGLYEIKVLEYLHNKDVNNSQALLISKTIESVPLNKIEADVTVIREGANGINASFADQGIKYSDKGLLASVTPSETEYQFVVVSDHLDDTSLFGVVKDSLVSGGFLLIQDTPETEIGAYDFLGFQLISRIVTADNVFFFFKKPAINYPTIYINIDETFSWIEELKAAFTIASENNEKILLIGQGNPTLGILGLVNCLKIEPGRSNIRCLFVEDADAPTFSEKEEFYVEQLKKDLVMNVYKNGKWGSYRHLVIPSSRENKVPTKYALANTTLRGDISTVQWMQDIPPTVLHTDIEIRKRLVYVYYSSISDTDVSMLNLKGSKYISIAGARDHEEYISMEFSGRDNSGKRVMGLVNDKAVATTVLADPDFLWDVPEDWSLEQASVVPLAYTTAYYSLVIRGKLRPNQSILIHEGFSVLSQAAIPICINIGCKVYVTGNAYTFMYLKETYPEITDDQLINTEKLPLEYAIMKATKCKGVDVILNSNSDATIRELASRCLTKNGELFDVRKVDERDVSYGIEFLNRGLAYHSVYPEAFFENGYMKREERIRTAQLVREGIETGVVTPTLTTPFTELDKAVSYVVEGNYIGKVVFEVKAEEFEDSIVECSPAVVNAIRETYFNPKKSYIILGGLGGFGVELCKSMLNKNARYLVVVSRSGIRTEGQKVMITEYKKSNGKVIISTADCSRLEGAREVIEEAASLAPIGGIFNLAAVLKDSIFENLTAADFESVCNPKVKATRNLDVLSRELCPELDYFVTFSSVSCGRGNAGQTNYGMANSAMDRICEARKEAGYPALSIQWGAIGDVGLILEKMFLTNDIEVGGIIPQKLLSCLSTMYYFCQLDYPVLSTVVLASKTKAPSNAQLKPANVVANILGIKDMANVNKNLTLVELGTDSLTNVEIKQTLERKFKIILSAQEILQLTFVKLEELN